MAHWCWRTARIPYANMDDKCPALALIWHLKRQGWKEVDRRCTHETAAITVFDGAGAIKQRSYLQCAAALGKCIALTSHKPSRCPVS